MTQRHPSAKSGFLSPTAWKGEVARWYDSLVGEKGSPFHRDVIFPQVLRLLNLNKGERVLDLACGQGAFCRVLQKAGVTAVGIDASAELIDMARKRSGSRIQYVVGTADRLDSFPPGSFDAITCILAIQNIEPVASVFSGCGRLLRQGGRLVLVMSHPAFRIPRQSEWGWDAKRKLLYRRVDRYLSSLKIPIQTHPGADPSLITWSFHRPLQSYVRWLADAGLWVNSLEEWPSAKVSQPGPRAKAENRARAEIPLFLAMRAAKAG